MVNCCLCEDIYKGQFKNQKYRIWTIMGRESELAYWYVVMFDTTYGKEFGTENIDIKDVNDRVTNQAVDIRKLPNYKALSAIEIFHCRKTLVVPLIKEALKTGYIKPL